MSYNLLYSCFSFNERYLNQFPTNLLLLQFEEVNARWQKKIEKLLEIQCDAIKQNLILITNIFLELFICG